MSPCSSWDKAFQHVAFGDLSSSIWRPPSHGSNSQIFSRASGGAYHPAEALRAAVRRCADLLRRRTRPGRMGRTGESSVIIHPNVSLGLHEVTRLVGCFTFYAGTRGEPGVGGGTRTPTPLSWTRPST